MFGVFLEFKGSRKHQKPEEPDGISWHGNVLSIDSQVFQTTTARTVLTDFSNTHLRMLKKHYLVMLLSKHTSVFTVLYTTDTSRVKVYECTQRELVYIVKKQTVLYVRKEECKKIQQTAVSLTLR